jgi:hypothetical protein
MDGTFPGVPRFPTAYTMANLSRNISPAYQAGAADTFRFCNPGNRTIAG